MSEIRVINIGNQILVVQGNKAASFYDKDKLEWSAVDGNIILTDKTLDSSSQLISSEPNNFITPTNKEVSIVDLLISFNNMLLVPGSLPEKVIVGSYTLTNDDANYLLLWDLSGGNATIKLPPDAIPGLLWRIKDTGNAVATTNEGTINGNGRLIEGISTSPVINAPYERRDLRLSKELGEYLHE